MTPKPVPPRPGPSLGHFSAPARELRRVDANGTMLRLRALHVMGHGCARIAHATGVRDAVIQRIVRGQATSVTAARRDAVTRLYDRWWDKRAPSHTPADRQAATRARRRAQRAGWCAPAALDDDQLDIPGYRPDHGWKPATGTGAAPDLHPPAPGRQAETA